MKIGVIADTHMPERGACLPAKVVEAFKGVDMIIHAGDAVELPVLQALAKLSPKLVAVCGNMDDAAVRKHYPAKQVVSAGKFKIGVMHGWGPPSGLEAVLEDAFRGDNVDMVVFGHSHAALNKKKGKTIFFNPGSPTDNIFAAYQSFGIITVNDTIDAQIIKI